MAAGHLACSKRRPPKPLGTLGGDGTDTGGLLFGCVGVTGGWGLISTAEGMGAVGGLTSTTPGGASDERFWPEGLGAGVELDKERGTGAGGAGGIGGIEGIFVGSNSRHFFIAVVRSDVVSRLAIAPSGPSRVMSTSASRSSALMRKTNKSIPAYRGTWIRIVNRLCHS